MNKEDIEDKIKKHNLKHFTKAYESKAHNDKIHAELTNSRVKDDMLNKRLSRDECDNTKVWEFLSLLAVSDDRRREEITHEAEITEVEWEREVALAKKSSASSIFSNRTYTVCKCALPCKRLTATLVSFYNMLLKHMRYVKRWLNIVDMMLEKGKGPTLGKLRTITLIEGDLQILMRIFLNAKDEELIEKD